MKLVKKIILKPSKNQKEAIDFWLRRCTFLYNVALEEKISYYKATGKYLSVFEQKKELVDIKDFDSTWKEVPNKSLQDVLFRLDKTFKSFFKRGCKGFPRFKLEYGSLYFVETDVRVKNGELFLPKLKTKVGFIGDIPEKYSSCNLKKEGNTYSLSFVTEVIVSNKTKNNNQILGVDLGLGSLYVDSNGYSQSRFSKKLIKKYNKRIEELNKSLATKKYGSKRRNKVKKQLTKTYLRLKNTRKDFLHKVTNKLLKNKEDNIIVGDIQVNKIIKKTKNDISKSKPEKKNLIKSFYSNSLTIFKSYIEYKGKLRNKNVIFVNEAYTSKTCSCCGHIKEMSLKDRVYECNNCKNSINRDYNSAINMKLLGSSIIYGNIYGCSLDSTPMNSQVSSFIHI
jgi:putative transposase